MEKAKLDTNSESQKSNHTERIIVREIPNHTIMANKQDIIQLCLKVNLNKVISSNIIKFIKADVK
jgi:hypothetical protein